METLTPEKAMYAVRLSRFADQPSKPDEIDVQGESSSTRYEWRHPGMGVITVHSFRDEAKAFPDPEDMGIYRERLSP